jgi:hypothetical protein
MGMPLASAIEHPEHLNVFPGEFPEHLSLILRNEYNHHNDGQQQERNQERSVIEATASLAGLSPTLSASTFRIIRAFCAISRPIFSTIFKIAPLSRHLGRREDSKLV